MSPELVILGNLLVDDVVFADGRTRMGEAGGAVLYAALGASLWEARVGCVSWRGDDYPEAALAALAARGVDLLGVHRLGRSGVRTWILYEEYGRQLVHRLGCPSHEEVSPDLAQVPGEWHGARAFHLAPMPFARQQSLLAGLPAEALRSVDPYLPVTEETLGAWRALLSEVDVFFPSEELQLRGAQQEPQEALRRLRGGRLRLVALKQGARGGLLYDAQQDRFHRWLPQGKVVDPTGAGDAFAAGFLSALLAGEGAAAAMQRGVVTASFAIISWGPEGLLGATPAEARHRLALAAPAPGAPQGA